MLTSEAIEVQNSAHRLMCDEQLLSHLSSSIECAVVGTSDFRTSSIAAWTDHAKRAGIASILLIAAGEGPTVLTEILPFAMANACGCVMTSSECDTAEGLSRGSPIPINTTFVKGG